MIFNSGTPLAVGQSWWVTLVRSNGQVSRSTLLQIMKVERDWWEARELLFGQNDPLTESINIMGFVPSANGQPVRLLGGNSVAIRRGNTMQIQWFSSLLVPALPQPGSEWKYDQ